MRLRRPLRACTPQRSVSHARFQITQETCVYFKVDYWGQLPVTLTPESFNLNRFLSAREMYEDEVRNIFPSRPLSELADKGVDPTVYGKSLTQQHVTTRGVVHQGVNYIGECITRTGGYSGHCSQMAVPSYSTAKGIFAGFAMMRLAEKYGVEVYDELIQTWLPGEVASATGYVPYFALPNLSPSYTKAVGHILVIRHWVRTLLCTLVVRHAYSKW